MLLGVKQLPEDTIVEFLARKPGAGAGEIQQRLKSTGLKVSRPQLFRDLHALQQAGVVVSVKGRYFLSLAWIVELVYFADEVHEQNLEHSPLASIFPEGTRSRRWKYFEYCRLSNFWNHVRLALVKETGEERIYEWLPHSWQHLIHHEKCLLFYKALKRSNGQLYRILGGDTYLDRLHLGSWPKDVVHVGHAEGPFAELGNTYLTVSGDYVFEISVIGKTYQELEDLFQSVKNAKSLRIEQITELLYKKGRFGVSLQRNPRKAEKLRMQFEEYFL